ncbi:P-loop containing nucleoside triphosphate hydrolase protein [Lipomyces tetrasporus]|uniref:Nucleolar GTP-binding protein 1 n=1 Tax=Lipomyces tetrasporus TaxID=54092 RepID=A0AAD7QR75_9ASCO|nr:P-loop containing nucleoside triphosphate hydrolase protein [Lipomyces tetrasporus]KAJ8099973.1 P-loop containing nucleoside triphosphate hydrolase protein [Lipomyces tetrasporus]
MKVTWKDIAPVPNSTEFLDVVLNRTQRKTPTVIRPGFKISRIRAFYMRKVRYTADGFTEKLQEIVESFPRLDDIHPFHQDLLNTLYDRDHYKIALSQLSMAKHLIEQVSRDYVRLLKFGQSLFQCKQLKRAGMGRMATIVKRLKDPLLYLEQVRQHLGRLPAIDPNTRTLVICGYPNVGKSSFLKSITRAEVDVQPYAFTTKSLYVGHFDYKYLRFQAIDTPGILDHPLEEMNTIEMQSITAIAHLRSCVLYFMDLSEQCGFSVEAQVNLYHSIKPLFANKSVMVVINKIDAMKPEDLDPERQQLLQTITAESNVEIMQLSCHLELGVMEVRSQACEKLLAARIEQKMKGTKVNDVLNKIHLATPSIPRDGVERKPHIPEAVLTMPKYDPNDPMRRKLARDIEAENGGAGVFNINLKDKYLLEKDEWKNDIMPEVLDGKNVYDFLDPDIGRKLQELEQEEERLESSGFYVSDDEDIFETEEDADIRMKAEWIREKKKLIMKESRSRKALRNRAIIPRSKQRKTLSAMEKHLDSIHVDHSELSERARGRAESRHEPATEAGVDVIMSEAKRSKSRSRAPSGTSVAPSRFDAGLAKQSLRVKADRIEKMHQRERNRLGRAGEADRHYTESMPKHLFAGKRGIGKTQRR